MDLIPYVSINPTRLSFYRRPEGYRGETRPRIENSYQNLSNNEHYGIVSGKAKYRIRTAIDWMIYLAKNKEYYHKRSKKHFSFKLTFITLTLASKQVHDDHTIKKELLNHFLVEARKKWHVDHYLWRAESQKNGNIHFHILTDRFIPWFELRKTWNRIQNKLDYIDEYAKKQRELHASGFHYRPELYQVWNYNQQYKAYKKGIEEGWQNPNSTDIHSIKRINNLSAYLSKYCTKNDIDNEKLKTHKQKIIEFPQEDNTLVSTRTMSKLLKNRAIQGKLWRLSQSLSKLKSAIDLCDSLVEDEFEKIKKVLPGSVKYYDYNTNIYLPVHVWSKIVNGVLYNILLDYVKELSPV